MTQQVINNLDTGLVARTKINDNFSELYGGALTAGTVTSVGGTGTVSGLSLTGTVTTSGNLTLGGTLAVTPSNFAAQSANTVLAAPNGSSGVPTFRALVAADLPASGTIAEFANISKPSNPTDGVTLFTRLRANRHAIAGVSDLGITQEYQPQLGADCMGWWHQGTFDVVGTTITHGFVAATLGTGTTGIQNAGTILGSTPHCFYRSAATTNASNLFALTNSAVRYPFVRGSAAGCGGFYARVKFGINAINSSSLAFYGVAPVTTSIGTTWVGRVNHFGVGCRDTDSNLHLISCDNAASQTFIDLGAGFPGKTAGEIYTLEIFCAPNDTVMYYSLFRHSTRTVTTGNTSTTLPANTVFMNLVTTMNTGATLSTACDLGVFSGFYQTGPLFG